MSCRSDDVELDADVDVSGGRDGGAVREATPFSRETTLAFSSGVVERSSGRERTAEDSVSSRSEFSRIQPLASRAGGSPGFQGERTESRENGKSDCGSGRERTLRSADRGVEERPVSPVRFVENVRTRPLYVESAHKKTEHKTRDRPAVKDSDDRYGTDKLRTPTDRNDVDAVRQPSSEGSGGQNLYYTAQSELAAEPHHRQGCDRVGVPLSGEEVAVHSDVNAECSRTGAETVLSAGTDSDDNIVSSVVEHRSGSTSKHAKEAPVPSCLGELVTSDPSLPRGVDVDSPFVLQRSRHPASGGREDSGVGGQHRNTDGVCEQRTPFDSSTGAVPGSKSAVSAAASVADCFGASEQQASKQPSDSSWASLSSSTEPGPRNSLKPSEVQATQSSTLSAPVPEERSHVPSNLQSSRLTFGSVDSLLVGLDAETNPSPGKSKNKKSWLKSWFTPKKGKYNPGSESIPCIQTAGDVSENDNLRVLKTDEDQTSTNTNDDDSQVQDAVVDNASTNTDDSCVLKAHENQTSEDPVPTEATIMDGSITKRSHSSEMSQHIQQETTRTQTVSSSRSDSDGVQSTTVKTFSGSTHSQQTVLQQRTVQIEDSRSPASADEKSAGSEKVLSLLSDEVLRGSSAGAYENTNVTFGGNVTRHEVITIKGTSLNSYDKSVMLNDSGFPDDLGSTFKAKPVMVRERKVSSSGAQEHRASTSFARQGSDSSSCLSLVELDQSGMMKLSQKHGSAEDLEMFSKASRIVHAQKSDDLLQENSGDEGEPELVVIREYIFATRKQSGGAARVETSSEFKTVTSNSVHASLQSSFEAEDRGRKTSGVTPALKEDDSGLDSPPSLQDSLQPPVKPKRSGRVSREMDVGETSRLKTESREDPTTDSGNRQSTKEQDHTVTVEAHSKPTHAMTIKFRESEDTPEKQQQQPCQPESFVNRIFASQQAAGLETSPAPSKASLDKGREKLSKPGDYAEDLGAASSGGPTVTIACKKHADLSEPSYKDTLSAVSPSDGQTVAVNEQRELPAQTADRDGSSAELTSFLSDKTGKESSEPDDTKRGFQTPVPATAPSNAAPEKEKTYVCVSVVAPKYASQENERMASSQPDDTTEVSVSAVAPTYAAPEKKQKIPKREASQEEDKTEVSACAAEPKDASRQDGKTADSKASSSVSPIYAVPDKKHKEPVVQSHPEVLEESADLGQPSRAAAASPQLDPPLKQLTSGQHDVPEQAKKSSAEDAPKDVDRNVTTENISKDEIKLSSAATVMGATPPHQHQPDQEGTAAEQADIRRKKGVDGKDDNKSVENSSKLPERLSRYRDSLTEEEYNKPWSSDFTRLEDDIRNRITSAFPSAQEEDECEEDAIGKDRAAPDSAYFPSETPPQLSAVRKAPSVMSKTDGVDSGPESDERNRHESQEAAARDSADEASVDDTRAASNSVADPVAVYADLQYGNETEGAEQQAPRENVILPASAVPAFSNAPAPKKSVDKSERPPPPLPPSPLEGKASREAVKPALHEKPHKPSSEEKVSSHHHNKLREKFKKVFSHSSEDKKAAKAEHKKGLASAAAREESKGVPSHAEEEDKAVKAEFKKTEEDKKASRPEQTKAPSPAKEEPKEISSHSAEETKAPETNRLSLAKSQHEGIKEAHPSTEENKNGSEAEPGRFLSVQSSVHEVKLPLSPKEARRLIKAEKKNASKARQEHSKEATSTDDPKVTSANPPNKALNWIKKKLATKGKKAPKTKKYNISSSLEAEEEPPDADAKSPAASDANSASEESHDSGSSHSDSDNDEEEEKKKPKRKMPFWGGKKDKKKVSEQESDSDSSADESKSKLFSWSLGRKKAVDSSDHEDNIPASYRKSADWTPGDDSGGITGTFKKIPDNVPLSQGQGASESNSSKTTEGQPPKRKEGTAEAPLLKKGADSPLHSKTKSGPASESGSVIKPEDAESNSSPKREGDPSCHETDDKTASEKGKVGADHSQGGAGAGSEDTDPADRRAGVTSAGLLHDDFRTDQLNADDVKMQASTQDPGKTRLESSKAKPNLLAAPPKLFLIDDSGEPDSRKRDTGDYAKFRKDATVGKTAAKSPKVPVNSGYELARPLFQEESSKTAIEEDLPDASQIGLSVGKRDSAAEENVSKLKNMVGEMPEDFVVEDAIVPVKAERPVHRALKMREKSAGGDPGADRTNGPAGGSLQSGATKRQTTLCRSQADMSVSSPTASVRRNKPSLQPDSQPKLGKEEAERDPAVEEKIVPRKAEEEFRTFNLGRSPAFKRKLRWAGADEPPRAPKSVGDSDTKLDTDTKDPVTQHADGRIDAKPQVDVDSSDSTNTATKSDPSPRSNTDSDGSTERTHIDRSNFLDTARTSWRLQEDKPSGAESEPDAEPDSSRENLDREKASMPEADHPNEIDASFKGAAASVPDAEDSEVSAKGADKTETDLPAADSGNVALQSTPAIGHSSNQSAEKPRPAKKPAITAQKPVRPAITAQKPTKATVSVQEPAKPTETAEGLGDAAGSKSGLPNADSWESNARNVSCRKPSELLNTSEPREAAEDAVKPEAVAKTQSQPAADLDCSSVSAIDWLDTQKGPQGPVVTAPKPNVRPKVFAKPKGFKPKGDNRDSQEPESKSGSSPQQPATEEAIIPRAESSNLQSNIQAKAILEGMGQKNEVGISKPAPKGQKPVPASKPIKTPRDEAGSSGGEIEKRAPRMKSPEPRPRTSLNVSPDSASDPSQTSTDDEAATSTPATARRDPGENDRGVQDNKKLNKTTPLPSSTGGEDSCENDALTDPSTTSCTDPSTSSWGEGDTGLTPGSNVGDFTFSLDPATKPSEERVVRPYATTSFKRRPERKEGDTGPPGKDATKDDTDSAIKDQKHESLAPSEGDSSFTDVTPLSELQRSNKSTPLLKSTPVSESTPLSSKAAASTSSALDEITVTSISTIHESTITTSETSTSLTSAAVEQSESEIYEPIFFQDLNDPNSNKKPTEAPPVRPEKVRKRNKDHTPEIVQPAFDDDMDNMYDVPPSRRQFAFPKENSLPVMSVVDKRSSKISLKAVASFEPEDSIAPYATYHRPQFVKQESDYGDDENPYMNDGEDLQQNLSSVEAPSVGESRVFEETDEVIHASLSELALETLDGNTTEKENVSQSLDPEQTEATRVGDTCKPDSKKAFKVKSMMEPSDSESSGSSSESEPDALSSAEAAKSQRQKGEKSKDRANEKSAGISAATMHQGDKPDTDNDQFLQSDEYVNSVEEINKLYAALEKEEEEMERRASVRKPQSPESHKEPESSQSPKESQPSESHTDSESSESHKEPLSSESHKEPQASQSHKEPQPSQSYKKPEVSERPAKAPLGRLLSFEEQRAELKPLKRKTEDELPPAIAHKPEEPTKAAAKIKSKVEGKAGKKKESKTTTTTIITTQTSSVETTVVNVHSTKMESSHPPGKAVADEPEKKTTSKPEKHAVKPRRPSEEELPSREKEELGSPAEDSVLPPITGYSKLVDKAVHRGEEQQVKVRPEGGEDGQGGAGGHEQPGKEAEDGRLFLCLHVRLSLSLCFCLSVCCLCLFVSLSLSRFLSRPPSFDLYRLLSAYEGHNSATLKVTPNTNVS